MWHLWIYHTFTTHDNTSELFLVSYISYPVQIRTPKNEEWGKQLLHSCKVLLFFINCLLVVSSHLPAFAGIKSRTWVQQWGGALLCVTAIPPLSRSTCVDSMPNQETFVTGGAAVRRINVLLARHDGGFAVLSRAFILMRLKRQKGLKSSNKQTRTAGSYLQCCACSRFPSSAEWTTDGVIWERDPWH